MRPLGHKRLKQATGDKTLALKLHLLGYCVWSDTETGDIQFQ